MEKLIENLTKQLQKIVEEHPFEVEKDTYWRGVKIGLKTAIEVAQKKLLAVEDKTWLSPVESEREQQEKGLKEIFPSYPDVNNWQCLNGLIYLAKSAAEDKKELLEALKELVFLHVSEKYSLYAIIKAQELIKKYETI